VFIPLQPHFLALQGLSKLLQTVSLVAQRLNHGLRVGGILLCMYESNTRLASEVVDDIGKFLEAGRSRAVPWSKAVFFNTRIRRNIKLAESPSHGQSIFEYDKRSAGAVDYVSLAKEVLGLDLDRADAPRDATASESPGGQETAAAAPVVQPSPIQKDHE
jgi:chromosome partitioning protein